MTMGWHTWSGTDGNIDTAVNYIPTGPPAVTDDVKFPANHGLGPTTNPASVVKWGILQTDKQSTMDLWTSGAPGEIAASKIDIAGRGNVYIRHDANAAANDIDRLIIRPSKFDAAVVISSVEGSANELDNTLIQSGAVEINSNGADMAVVTVGELSPGSLTSLLLNAQCGTLTSLYMFSGAMRAANVVTNAIVSPGAVLTKTDGLITNGWISGSLNYNDDGDMEILHALPGSVVDFTQAPVADTDGLTIEDFYEWEESTVRMADHVIITNHHRMG